MKVIQLIHQLNNTELGKTGMADCYINVTKDIDIADMFAVPSSFMMIHASTGKRYDTFRYEVGSEQRVYGFGPLYRAVKANAGDLVVVELRERLYVDIIKYENVLVFYKKAQKFDWQVLNENRLHLIGKDGIPIMYNDEERIFKIEFTEALKKRADARVATNYYKIYIDDKDISPHFWGKSYLKLVVNGDYGFLLETNKDKKIILDWD